MTAIGYSRGNHIEFDEIRYIWVYSDTKEPIKDNERPCARCGRLPTKEGYDACLGYIKGASSACCGHGKEKGYIVYNDKGGD
jgi:hypothetical protein